MHNVRKLAIRAGIPLTCVFALGAILAACGGGSTGGLGTGTGAGGSGSGGTDGGGGTSSTGTGGMTATGMCNGSPPAAAAPDKGPACACPEPADHEICPLSVPTAPDCAKDSKARPVELCGVLMNLASNGAVELVRTTTTDEYSDPSGGAVDTSCFDKATWPKKGGDSKKVTVTGYARNFANGCDSANSKIEIYTVKRGGSDDGNLGDLVGSAVTLPNDACTDATCKLVNVPTKCDQGNPRVWRKFSYANVPTETELIIKTSSADGMNGFAVLYDYNNYIRTEEVDAASNSWSHDVRVVNVGDYSLIPTTAIGRTITSGNGVIAGEIHDCDSAAFPEGVRLSGASIDVSANRADVGYFTDNENAPLPDPSRTGDGTSTLGLYAAYDMKPGAVRVAASGVVGGKLVTLGYYDVRVFPDAVTGVTLHGLRPFQADAAGK